MSKQTYRTTRALDTALGRKPAGALIDLTAEEAAPLLKLGAVQLKPARKTAPPAPAAAKADAKADTKDTGAKK